jgi:RNA polymerase sigma factor (TIGR02999 family)
MRQIVIDHARARLAQKRGGADLRLVGLDEAEDIADGELDSDQLVRLGEALAVMETEEPRLAQLVDLRFFAGLGLEEIAALTDTSPRTLSRDWRRARAQLYEALNPS